MKLTHDEFGSLDENQSEHIFENRYKNNRIKGEVFYVQEKK